MPNGFTQSQVKYVAEEIHYMGCISSVATFADFHRCVSSTNGTLILLTYCFSHTPLICFCFCLTYIWQGILQQWQQWLWNLVFWSNGFIELYCLLGLEMTENLAYHYWFFFFFLHICLSTHQPTGKHSMISRPMNFISCIFCLQLKLYN